MHEWHLPDRVLRIGHRPLVMGIVNVTPDSFSDGGQHAGTEGAIAHALELVRQGADILDIGGESTRPGSTPVSSDEELHRVLPVVESLARQVTAPISIDTSKAEVARACVAAGAKIVNDVTGLVDPAMSELVRQTEAGAIVMHMQGTPQTMQQNPSYQDVTAEIARYFEQRLHDLTRQGIAAKRLALDPGIGFGKTSEHNLQILARLADLGQIGQPICLGASRKGFIGWLAKRPVQERLAGSLAVVCHAVSRQAAQIVRVHDVAPTVDAVTVIAAILDREPEPESRERQRPEEK